MTTSQSLTKPNRRIFIAGQACAMTVAGAVTAQASVPVLADDLQTPPTWVNATAEKMTSFVRDRFLAVAEDGTSLTLRLIRVDATNSGPARPSSLARSEGLVATFASPNLNWFVENGAQSVRMKHPVLGHSDVFISATPKRRGGHDLHVVLN